MEIFINKKQVDTSTIEIDGIYTDDHPDYCDAYVTKACFIDGKSLDEDELMEFEESYPEIIDQMAFESLFYM